jgi:hypothetical protein
MEKTHSYNTGGTQILHKMNFPPTDWTKGNHKTIVLQNMGLEGLNYTEIEKTAHAGVPKFLIRYIARIWK